MKLYRFEDSCYTHKVQSVLDLLGLPYADAALYGQCAMLHFADATLPAALAPPLPDWMARRSGLFDADRVAGYPRFPGDAREVRQQHLAGVLVRLDLAIIRLAVGDAEPVGGAAEFRGGVTDLFLGRRLLVGGAIAVRKREGGHADEGCGE
jgi:hypothetical protein